MGRREGTGVQARAGDKGGQAGGRGQEQGAGRWRRQPGAGEAKRGAAPRVELVDLLAERINIKLIAFDFIQILLSIHFLS